MNTFNPLSYPISLLYPTRIAPTHWAEHVPFAMTLIDLVRPEVLVELGTFCGVSYCAFCQAISHLRLNTRAFAVDTWQGDPHNGSNGPELLAELRAFHDPRYGSYSRLVPSSFDDALPHFADGAIDLLHIDGYHIYDAVNHDFTNWLPKMSKRGVVVLHDINVREYNFGVWKLWDEIKVRYPSFDFIHEHGLGVVAVGSEIPEGLRPLLESAGAERVAIRDYFYHLGQRITARWNAATLEKKLFEQQQQTEARLREQRAGLESELAHRQADSAGLRSQLAEAHQHLTAANGRAEEQARRLEKAEPALDVLRSRLAKTEQMVRVAHAEVEEKTELLAKVEARVFALQAEQPHRDAQLHNHYTAATDWERRCQALCDEIAMARSNEQSVRVLLHQTHTSLAWRFAHKLSRCSHRLAPVGTRRRRVLGAVRRAARALVRQGMKPILRQASGLLSQLFA